MTPFAPPTLAAPDSAAPAGPRVLTRAHALTRGAPVRVTVPLPTAPSAPPPDSYSLAPAPAPAADLDLDALRAAWEAEQAAVWAARIAEARAEGAAEARAEAEAALADTLDALRAEFAADAGRLVAAWGAFCERVETLLVPLALEAAEAAAAPLAEPAREALAHAVAHAVEALGTGADRVTVRLHPVDLLRLQERGLTDALRAAAATLRWAADDTLAEGDWAVESAEAVVRHVRAEWFGALRGALGDAGREETGHGHPADAEPPAPTDA